MPQPVAKTEFKDAKNSISELHILRELAETTWRIALPVVIFAVIGIIGDLHFRTRPWLTLSSVVVGFIIAGILVKRQIVLSEEDKNI
jgi:F0F1-type ATP synthase assembly protein I